MTQKNVSTTTFIIKLSFWKPIGTKPETPNLTWNFFRKNVCEGLKLKSKLFD